MGEGATIIVTNSDWEIATHAAGPWLTDLAQRFGEKWETVELHREEDTYDGYSKNFVQGKTKLHFGCGHGNSTIYTGYGNTPILTCPPRTATPASKFAGAIHYLLSCLTGQRLGPWLVENGAVAYIGWKKTYKLMISDPDDPLNDPYVRATVYPGLSGLEELLDEKTVGDAEERIRREFQRVIDEWKSRNPMVASVAKWDLDGLTVLGDKSAKLPPPSPTPPPPPSGEGYTIKMSTVVPPFQVEGEGYLEVFKRRIPIKIVLNFPGRREDAEGEVTPKNEGKE